MKFQQNGFTLIEMMITVAIFGIIAAIAIPSYSDFVRRGKRSDAKVELLRVAGLQQSYYVQNSSFAQDLSKGAGGLGISSTTEFDSEQGAYKLKIKEKIPAGCNGQPGAKACTGYVLEAVPQNGQADDKCKTLTLSGTGAKDVSTTATLSKTECWK